MEAKISELRKVLKKTNNEKLKQSLQKKISILKENRRIEK
mgnify:CR=1 FL=1